ncbi:hypothetical protein PQX77_006563 [Marasmius sp. AFHP31]|nr:hypothetical protein PQX77_006563 [Marasmius sp. AFHP31]
MSSDIIEMTPVAVDVGTGTTTVADGKSEVRHRHQQDPETASQYEDTAALSPQIPPADRGFHAWAYLISAAVLDFLIWGLAFTYGVFLDHYKTHDFPNSPAGLIALPGSLSSGILCLSTIFIMPFVIRFPEYNNKAMAIGYIICVVSLVGAAFSTQASHLVVTQGVFFSLGGSILYYPMMSYLFDWFEGRKGFANGVLFSGASLGGVILPFIIQPLLERYGRRTTLLGLAVSFAIGILPCFLYLKPREPVKQRTRHVKIDPSFLRRAAFWIIFGAPLIQGLGNFMPFLYLPSFASDLNLSSTVGTLTVALVNGASGPGLIFFGWLSDRFDLRIPILLSSLGSAVSVFLIWGLARGVAPLLVFACLYGFLAPSWGALYPRFASASVGDDSKHSSSLVYIFMAGRGLGNTLAAPISAGLMHPWSLTDQVPFGYGVNGYGPLILFTAVTLLTSSLAVMYHFVDAPRRRLS